jgi:nitrite reductase/ring-hydroxylating ferredoxin subunit
MRSEELVARHVAGVRIHDAEFAVWRDANGHPNAWENRCPHRGMRFTMGSNIGDSIVCRYHGWRFAAGSGACTLIPAHPRQVAPRAATARTYTSTEKYGLVWIGWGAVRGEPALIGLADEPRLTFRSVTIHAPIAAVRAALGRDVGATARDDDSIRLPLAIDGWAGTCIALPVAQSPTTTIVHGVAGTSVPPPLRLAVLQAHNDRLKLIRDVLEAAHTAHVEVPESIGASA